MSKGAIAVTMWRWMINGLTAVANELYERSYQQVRWAHWQTMSDLDALTHFWHYSTARRHAVQSSLARSPEDDSATRNDPIDDNNNVISRQLSCVRCLQATPADLLTVWLTARCDIRSPQRSNDHRMDDTTQDLLSCQTVSTLNSGLYLALSVFNRSLCVS